MRKLLTFGSTHRRHVVLWAALACGLSALIALGLRLHFPEAQDLSLRGWGRNFQFGDARALWLLPLIPLLVFALGRSFADLPWQQRALSFLLRSCFFVSLVFGLTQPQEREESSRVCTLLLLDVSSSVGDSALHQFRETLRLLEKEKSKEDELRLLLFAEKTTEFPLVYDKNTGMKLPSLDELREGAPGKASNVENVVDLAAAWTRTDCITHYLLFSDGIETRGHALAAIARATNRGVEVHTQLLDEAPPADVALVELEVPQNIKVGEAFQVRVHLNSIRNANGELRLYQEESLNGLGGVKKVSLQSGQSTHTFASVVRVPGDISYRAEFIPEGDDAHEENNHFTISVEVAGPPRILLIDRNPHQATYLAQALVAQQLHVEVRGPHALPQSPQEMGAFQFLILSDMSRTDVSRSGQLLIEEYVRAGGGLLFSGGEAGYGPGGWQGSKLEKILPVRMDGSKEREIPMVAMSLVIDRSGSMTGLPLAMAKEACNATLGVLDPNDLIEVIAFDSRPKRYVKMQPARYRSRIENSVSRIKAGGGTEIFNSLDMAYQDLAAIEARKKHIILLTDGNAGSDGLYELASAAFAEGITITTVGLGSGVNRELLTLVSEAGGGRFHGAEDPAHLPRIFTRETELISKKPTLDDWFPVGVAQNAGFLQGVHMGGAPLLRGYTSTQLAPPPAELILVSDRGEPILARRPVGLGWTLAWTSDLKARWATDWLKWPQFSRFISQLVRKHQQSDDREIRPMVLELQGEELIATVDAYDESENFDNSLSSSLEIRLLGDNEKSEASGHHLPPTPFVHVAPGLYQARTRLPSLGAYAVKATHFRLTAKQKKVAAGVSFGSVSRPYAEEFRDLRPRPQALKSWAQLGGGKFDPAPSEVWNARDKTVLERKSRQNEFIWISIFLFLSDLLLRRVRLFGREALA